MSSRSQRSELSLNKIRNEELERVRRLDPGFSCQGQIGTFVSLYLQSEVFGKKLQKYYRTDQKRKGKDELNIDSLRAAIRHFELDFPESDLEILFKGGNGIRGKKTARQLRNGYLHSLAESDREEIQSSASKFNKGLKSFLELRLR